MCLYANQLVFAHTFASRPRLVLYPRLGSLTVDITWTRIISLDKNRSIDLSVATGDNEIVHANVRLRPASAGLRLHIGKAEIQEPQDLDRDTTAGVLSLKRLAPNVDVPIRIPYSLEHDLHEISTRVEVMYTTQLGDFSYVSLSNTPIQLPLGVNVRDVFKANRLVSVFDPRDLLIEIVSFRPLVSRLQRRHPCEF